MDGNGYKSRSTALTVVLTAVVTLAITVAAYYAWTLFYPRYEISFDSGKVSITNIKKYNQVRNILDKSFYKDVNENVLLEGAIEGMAQSLNDPYTVYYDKEQMKALTELTNKSEETYVGIGVSIVLDNNGVVSIIEPFDDSPAKKAGIKPGDKIIKVDDKDVTGLKDENLVVSMIKGPENTKVRITVFRPSEGRTFDYNITRQKINVVLNIRSRILRDDIGYIRIMSFMDNAISRYFNNELDRMLASGIKGLIIDVRDNPGGNFEQVVSIVGRLVPKGLIVYTEDRYKKRETKYSSGPGLDIPLAILVNGNSASASEILAGAVKDRKKGIIVGTKTFGKGLVQQVIWLDDGSGIKVTVARYFMPSGVSIQGVGVKPDITVDAGEEYRNTPVSQIPEGNDVQLNAAFQEVKAAINGSKR